MTPSPRIEAEASGLVPTRWIAQRGADEDLWDEPDEAAKAKPKPAEEAAPEPAELAKPKKKAARPRTGDEGDEMGGWGGKVEREKWGDEERAKGVDALDEKVDEAQRLGAPVGAQEKNPRRPSKIKLRPGKEVEPEIGASPPAAPHAAQPSVQAAPEPAASARVKKPGGQAEPTAREQARKPETPRKALEMPAALPREDGAEGSPDKDEVLLPSGTFADLSGIWEKRRIHLEQRDLELVDADLDRLMELQRELGIRNLPLYASVLIRQAQWSQKAQDPVRATKLIDSAIRLAPDLAEVHLAQASLLFAQSPANIGPIIGARLQAIRQTLRDPLARNRLWVNLGLGLLLGLTLSAGLFLLVQFGRHVRLFYHDFHHAFPKGASRWQTGTVATIIVLLPLVLRFSLLTILLYWAFLSWIYEERRERWVTLGIIGYFAIVPFLIQWAVAAMALPSSNAATLIKVAKQGATEQDLKRLEALIEKDPTNHVLLAVLGDYHKRTGRLDLAEKYLTKALGGQTDEEVLLNNLANVLFLEKKTEDAIETYNRALQLRPDLTETYYNLSRIYYKRAEELKGKDHQSKARRLDPDRVREWMARGNSRKAVDTVVDVPLPDEWFLTQRRKSPEEEQEAAQLLWEAWGGGGQLAGFTWKGIGFMMLLGGVLLPLRKRALAKNCLRCGRSVCHVCNPEIKGQPICGQCYYAFVDKSKVDPRTRVAKEVQVRQYQIRMDRLSCGLSFVVPGLGQFLSGRTLLGILFLSIFSGGMGMLLLSGRIMKSPYSSGVADGWVFWFPIGFVMLCFYVWAVVDGFRKKEW